MKIVKSFFAANPFLKLLTPSITKIVPAILFIVVLIIFNSCDKITEPIITTPEEIKPGRRDYVWKEYVLKPSFGYRALLNSMWEASLNDIWTCKLAYPLYRDWETNEEIGRAHV